MNPKSILLLCLLIFSGIHASAQTTIPPVPEKYFTDMAHVVTPTVGDKINSELADFERQTSNQFMVVIFPNLPDGQEQDQYSTEVFNAWKPGQKGKDNGVILFIYVKEHKIFISTGRGLQGVLPDATCKNIETGIIVPKFKQGDIDGGIQAGVDAIISASKGEYQGTGKTDHEMGQAPISTFLAVAICLGVIFFVLFMILAFYKIMFGGDNDYTPSPSITPRRRPEQDNDDLTPFIAGAALSESLRQPEPERRREPEPERRRDPEPTPSYTPDPDPSPPSAPDNNFSAGGGNTDGGGAGTAW